MKPIFIALILATVASPTWAAPDAPLSTPPGASPHTVPPASHMLGNSASTPAPISAESLPNAGKVLEVIETDLYSFIEVTSNNGPVWLATTKTKILKGDNIRYGQGAAMSNFTSRTLNRTFPSIIFIDRIASVKAGT
ncbi:MAG: hypothetical protein ABL860_07425 [Candidatus Nitrotoga sp.]